MSSSASILCGAKMTKKRYWACPNKCGEQIFFVSHKSPEYPFGQAHSGIRVTSFILQCPLLTQCLFSHKSLIERSHFSPKKNESHTHFGSSFSMIQLELLVQKCSHLSTLVSHLAPVKLLEHSHLLRITWVQLDLTRFTSEALCANTCVIFTPAFNALGVIFAHAIATHINIMLALVPSKANRTITVESSFGSALAQAPIFAWQSDTGVHFMLAIKTSKSRSTTASVCIETFNFIAKAAILTRILHITQMHLVLTQCACKSNLTLAQKSIQILHTLSFILTGLF
ncbi:hypothetical protein BpHYR1_041251 [Brachionus plicatilis]|uniref:Uncharacterized protein n=1 Tax=Brachionus plicatilis TaxID=10195 RepID=A0A3M7PY85_BRAPC|nr:hypothetical protein BpHYR1_041251 [Brachionus plicatilis]